MNDNSELLALLRLHQSTRGLDDRQLESLAAHAEIVTYQRNDVVHQANTPFDALSLVTQGRVRLAVVSKSGIEQAFHFVTRDGQIGLLGLSQNDPLPLTAVAAEQTVLLRFSAESAHALLQEHPRWQRNLLNSLGMSLRERVFHEKPRKGVRFVTFIHLSDKYRSLIPRLARQLDSWGERVGVLSDDNDTVSTAPGPSEHMRWASDEPEVIERIRQVIGGWGDLERVILDFRADQANDLDTVISRSTQVYWVCGSDVPEPVLSALEPSRERLPEFREKTFLIRMLKPDQPVAPHVPQLGELRQRDFLLRWSDGAEQRPHSQHSGWDRLLHHLRGVSVGLALGGGAAKGMAHLGVLQVLNEAGITIDRMSGTSAGALAGILYAAGYEPDFLIDAFAGDLKPGWPFRWLPWGDYAYMLGKYRFRRWDGMLRKYLHSWRLEQLPIPFSSITVDLVVAEKVIRETGDAVSALLESINLPIVAAPICREGMALVDGGILDVTPADVLSDQGANVVVAVDVAAKIPLHFAGNRPDTPSAKMKVPNVFRTSGRMRTVQDHNIRLLGASTADLVIEPDVSRVRIADFKNAREIAELGRTAAEAALPRLREILHATDPRMFP